jgi:hypothetical protein
MYNNVYYINLTIFWLQKISFPIKEISELAMLHAHSRKILLQNPPFLAVVEYQPAFSANKWQVVYMVSTESWNQLVTILLNTL